MSVNERLADAAVGHAVDLAQYGNGVTRRMLRLLDRVDADLVAQIQSALERLPADSFTVQRLEAQLGAVRELNRSAYEQVGRALPVELAELTQYEAQYQQQLFTRTLPSQVVEAVGVNGINIGQVQAAAMSRPFQGRLLSEWAQSIEAGRMTRIRDSIRMGYVENQTIDQMVRRIRGTRANNYADGLLEIDRRHAEAVVRTAVSHTAGYTRDQFYEANSDLIAATLWSSTLDARTTIHICAPRDGKRYTLEGKPLGHSLPWLAGPGASHWNCRSVSVPVTKSFRDLGIPIDEFSPADRASMDGAVPSSTTYSTWLAKQSADRQDEILGPTRGALLRNGGLTVDRFYNQKGAYLSLDELRERDAKAFKRAGL